MVITPARCVRARALEPPALHGHASGEPVLVTFTGTFQKNVTGTGHVQGMVWGEARGASREFNEHKNLEPTWNYRTDRAALRGKAARSMRRIVAGAMGRARRAAVAVLKAAPRGGQGCCC